MSMRSWASSSSPMPHITFWTWAEFLRPQTFSMGRSSMTSAMGSGAPRSIERTRLLGQHDRNAVADRIGELGRARDQFLLVLVVFERALCQRADQDLEQLGIDAAGRAIGRCGGHAGLHFCEGIEWRSTGPGGGP